MTTLISEAELQFYEGLKITTRLEILEMQKNELVTRPRIEVSINRLDRLNVLLTAYKTEIRNNLLLLDAGQKITMLDDCSAEAIALHQKLSIELDACLENAPEPYWALPFTNQNVLFLQEIIAFLNELKVKHLNNDLSGTHLQLQSIFNPENNAYQVCIDLLEDLDLTLDGIPNTLKGRAGKLTAVIHAVKSTPGMLRVDRPTYPLLLRYFNAHLKSDFKDVSKRNDDYSESLDQSKHFIKRFFKK